MKTSFATALLVSILRTTSAFAADEATQQEPSPRSDETSWYGWQTLVIDAGAVGMMALGASFGGQTTPDAWPSVPVFKGKVFYAGLGVYALGAPAVHAFRGRPGPALGDLGLRLGAPVVLGVACGIAGLAFSAGPGTKALGTNAGWDSGVTVGFSVGSLSAVAIDAALIARRPAQSNRGTTATSAVRWSPQIELMPGGGSVGLGGSF